MSAVRESGYALLSVLSLLLVMSIIGLGIIEQVHHDEKITNSVAATLNISIVSHDALAYLARLPAPEPTSNQAKKKDEHRLMPAHLTWQRLSLPSSTMNRGAIIYDALTQIGVFPIASGEYTSCHLFIYSYHVSVAFLNKATPVIWQEMIGVLQPNPAIKTHTSCIGKQVLSQKRV